MDLAYSLKWTLAYRLAAVAALLLGLGLVAAGFLAGFGSAITTLLSDPLNPGPAIERANPAITLLFCVLGIVVWQVGKTYALFLTLPRAAGQAAADRFDAERVSSEVTADLDERLAAMEADIAQLRRELAGSGRDGHTATYDEDDHRLPAADAESEVADSVESTTGAAPAETAAARAGTDGNETVAAASDTSGVDDSSLETRRSDPLADEPGPHEDGASGSE